MWPWGHAAFGYVLYSLGSRTVRRRPPKGASVWVLLFMTQFPDLVDKPMSWVFHLFPQGDSVAHSIFVAVPLALAVFALAVHYDRSDVGAAVVVGWWSHLVGDVLAALLYGYGWDFAVMRVLWPVVTFPPYAEQRVALDRVLHYFHEFVQMLSTEQLAGVLLVYFGPFVLAFVLWLVDGAPGLEPLRRSKS